MTTKLPFKQFFSKFLSRFFSFFYRLQWKLTLAYTFFTLVSIVILGLVALALLWYLNFQSNTYPSRIAELLTDAAPSLAPHLEQTPPDRAGLQDWLDNSIQNNYLVINISRNKLDQQTDKPAAPVNLGEVNLVAIVDADGQLIVATPTEVATFEQLLPQLEPMSPEMFQAALQGETDTSQLATRDQDHLVVVVPIFGNQEQVVGAMLFKTISFPVNISEFFQQVIKRTILPFAGVMLVVGCLIGVIFGYFIARGLTRRLRELDDLADAWSKGNFEMLAMDQSGDELGQLARHFNHMAIQLQNLLQTRQELATLEERNRLARDLHDSVKQQVFATTMQVGAAKALLDEQPAAAKKHLLEAEQLVKQAQQELTTLILELRPAALEGKGLAKALQDYTNDWSRQTNIPLELRVRGERPLPLSLEQTLFRVAQESLANVARHSQASNVEVDLSWQDDQVGLCITDNGRGFNVTSKRQDKGVGLKSMQERLETLGGLLEVASKPGSGTCIKAQLKISQQGSNGYNSHIKP